MTNEIDKQQKEQTHGVVHDLLSKHSMGDPDKPNPKREWYLALLKSRYGYTYEKAVDELERLLKRFYSMNRSFGIHHTRSDSKHPHREGLGARAERQIAVKIRDHHLR